MGSGSRDVASGPISDKIFPGLLPKSPGGMGFPGPVERSSKKKDQVDLLFVQHAQSAVLEYEDSSEETTRARLVLGGVAPR